MKISQNPGKRSLIIALLGWLATTIIVLILLVRIWHQGTTHLFLLSGLIPMSDANLYYWDARNMIEGGGFSSYSSGRPLYTGLLMTLLVATQQNLQLTLAIIAVIVATSFFLLCKEIFSAYGFVTALFTLILVIWFYAQYVGTTMTENSGLIFGSLGFALLLRSISELQGNSKWRVAVACLGIFSLTIGLCARAGAFFVLPMLVLWGTFYAFGRLNRPSWRFFLLSTAAILGGFVINSWLVKTLGNPGSTSFFNFSFVLYGLVTGTSWAQVLNSYPDLASLPSDEMNRQIYGLILSEFLNNPLILISSILRAWKVIIFDNYAFAFTKSFLVSYFLNILNAIGFLICFSRRDKSHYSLILFAFLGVILSAPFLPPWDVKPEMRVYATTIPFLCILPALALNKLLSFDNSFILRKKVLQNSVNHSSVDHSTTSESFQFPTAITFCLVGVLLLSSFPPILIKSMSQSSQFEEVVCPQNLDLAYIRTSPNSRINIYADSSILNRASFSNNLSINLRSREFITPMSNFLITNFPELVTSKVKVNQPISLFHTLDLQQSSSSIWVFGRSNLIPEKYGVWGMCGIWATTNDHVPFHTFFVKAVYPAKLLDRDTN